MTIAQIVSALTSPAAILIAGLILAVVVRPWLLAHATQIDATTGAIQDERVRTMAQDIVRWLESDPDQAKLPGLMQRQNGISTLAAQLGIPLGQAGPAIDAAYNLLISRNALAIAPPPAAPVTPAVATASPDLVSVLTRLETVLTPLLTPAPTEAPKQPVAPQNLEQVAQAAEALSASPTPGIVSAAAPSAEAPSATEQEPN